MTTPASGTISMTDVAAELAASASGLALGSFRVRSMANRAAGAVAMADLWGKQRYALTVGYRESSVNEGGVDYPQYLRGADSNMGGISPGTLFGANIQTLMETERQGQGYRSLLMWLGGANRGKGFFTSVRVNGVNFASADATYASNSFFARSVWTWTYSYAGLVPGETADVYFT